MRTNPPERTLIPITDLSRRVTLPYISAWSKAHAGEFGEVVRKGGRIYVTAAGVKQFLRHREETEENHPAGAT